MKGSPRQRRVNLFDGFVLAGVAVNAAVALVLFGYWVVH